MTFLKPALITAAVALASPAFAGGFAAMPIMPTLTFPAEGAFEPATKEQFKLFETCTDGAKTCAKPIEDVSTNRKTTRGE